jgi:hypothetical protein
MRHSGLTTTAVFSAGAVWPVSAAVSCLSWSSRLSGSSRGRNPRRADLTIPGDQSRAHRRKRPLPGGAGTLGVTRACTFHGLRRTRPAAALFGSALNIVGLAVLAAGAIPHVVTSRLSDLYHAVGVSPDEQATLLLLWQANQAMFDALLLVGLLVMPVGIILFGLAMRLDPGYGKVAGTLSVALGVLGLAAATVMLVDPGSPVAALGVFALIGFHLVAGWKTYRLSTTASTVSAGPR